MSLFKKFNEIEQKALSIGFTWSKIEDVLQQIKDECQEIEESTSREHLQEEIGDLIHAAFSLAFYVGFDPRETFEKSLDKYEQRFNNLLTILEKEGYENLKDESPETMLDLWKEAKKITKP